VVVAIGINALGYREVLGNSFGEGFAYAVGDSEAEAFWRQFLSSLIAAGFCEAVERGLTGTRLVISDAHVGLTAAIKRMSSYLRAAFTSGITMSLPRSAMGSFIRLSPLPRIASLREGYASRKCTIIDGSNGALLE
jgi:hypothetical protein